jgi:hypothetical protein
MELYTYAQGLLDDVGNLEPAKEEEASAEASSPPETCAQDARLKRALLWSHHLLAQSKRKAIVDWSSELDLWAISKPGYVPTQRGGRFFRP